LTDNKVVCPRRFSLFSATFPLAESGPLDLEEFVDAVPNPVFFSFFFFLALAEHAHCSDRSRSFLLTAEAFFFFVRNLYSLVSAAGLSGVHVVESPPYLLCFMLVCVCRVGLKGSFLRRLFGSVPKIEFLPSALGI